VLFRSIDVKLVFWETNEKVWGKSFDIPITEASGFKKLRVIAQQIATEIAQPEGTLDWFLTSQHGKQFFAATSPRCIARVLPSC